MWKQCKRLLPTAIVFVLVCVMTVIFFYEEPLPIGPPYTIDSTALQYHIQPTVWRGRSKHNGTWLAVRTPHQGYAYSAFFDDRRSLGSLPVVRVIASMEETKEPVYCMLWYEEQDPPYVVEAELLAIGAGVIRSTGTFVEYVVSCPLDNENIPLSVSLAYDVIAHPAFKLPVEIPQRVAERQDFVVCVSVAYWHHDPHQLVEWVELLRLWGADLVTIYNNSLNPEAARVLKYYDATGFVDLRQSHNFLPQLGELTIHMHMSPVINDCMYRNMYRFKKVIVTDLDELIVPRQHTTYHDLVQAAEKEEGGRHPARHYMFQNAYFFTDIFGEDTQESNFLTTMRHRRRLPASEIGYACKSIIDPLACTNMHNHACWGRTRLYDRSGHTIAVSAEQALNQHYKRCHFDVVQYAGRCQEVKGTAVQDDTMLKYKEQLVAAVQPHLKALGLEQV